MSKAQGGKACRRKITRVVNKAYIKFIEGIVLRPEAVKMNASEA